MQFPGMSYHRKSNDSMQLDGFGDDAFAVGGEQGHYYPGNQTESRDGDREPLHSEQAVPRPIPISSYPTGYEPDGDRDRLPGHPGYSPDPMHRQQQQFSRNHSGMGQPLQVQPTYQPQNSADNIDLERRQNRFSWSPGTSYSNRMFHEGEYNKQLSHSRRYNSLSTRPQPTGHTYNHGVRALNIPVTQAPTHGGYAYNSGAPALNIPAPASVTQVPTHVGNGHIYDQRDTSAPSKEDDSPRSKIHTAVLSVGIEETKMMGEHASYHQNITGSEAEQRLAMCGRPCYLTRFSEKLQCYVLSVHKRDTDKHFKIVIEEDYQHRIDGKRKTFSDIDALLSYYERNRFDPAFSMIGRCYTEQDFRQEKEDRRAEELRRAEVKLEERRRLADELRLAEEQRRAEELRHAEQVRQAQILRQAEELRQAALLRDAEDYRQTEQLRHAEHLEDLRQRELDRQAEDLAWESHQDPVDNHRQSQLQQGDELPPRGHPQRYEDREPRGPRHPMGRQGQPREQQPGGQSRRQAGEDQPREQQGHQPGPRQQSQLRGEQPQPRREQPQPPEGMGIGQHGAQIRRRRCTIL